MTAAAMKKKQGRSRRTIVSFAAAAPRRQPAFLHRFLALRAED
jgi:hypothetical protein